MAGEEAQVIFILNFSASLILVQRHSCFFFAIVYCALCTNKYLLHYITTKPLFLQLPEAEEVAQEAGDVVDQGVEEEDPEAGEEVDQGGNGRTTSALTMVLFDGCVCFTFLFQNIGDHCLNITELKDKMEIFYMALTSYVGRNKAIVLCLFLTCLVKCFSIVALNF